MRYAVRFDAFLKQHGRELGDGNADVGLTLEDAWIALNIAREEGAIILGGDFYVLERGRMRAWGEMNWSTDPLKGESEMDYTHRSWLDSEKALREFPWSEYPGACVALVRAI